MTKQQLIQSLNVFPDDQEIMILDGHNGGGTPREINLISTHIITQQDSYAAVDCEDIVGTKVAILGFGCY